MQLSIRYIRRSLACLAGSISRNYGLDFDRLNLSGGKQFRDITTKFSDIIQNASVRRRVRIFPRILNILAYHDAYQARILELREIAEDDEDIEEINEDSIREFWTFMESAGLGRRAGLVLQDNGNLRAVWRDKAGHNVGLEFQGGRSVLYVMFKPYADGRKTFREADVATLDAVVPKLRELDLLTFVSA